MQTVMAVIWAIYGFLALREVSLVRHGPPAQPSLAEKWAEIETGMTADQVREALGSPVAIQATQEGTIWRFGLGGELGAVNFRRGRVATCCPPKAA